MVYNVDKTQLTLKSTQSNLWLLVSMRLHGILLQIWLLRVWLLNQPYGTAILAIYITISLYHNLYLSIERVMSNAQCLTLWSFTWNSFTNVNRSKTLNTVFHKKTTPYLIAHNFGATVDRFSKFFTLGLSSDCIINWSLKTPSQLKRVTTLPCKTYSWSN